MESSVLKISHPDLYPSNSVCLSGPSPSPTRAYKLTLEQEEIELREHKKEPTSVPNHIITDIIYD